MPKTSKSYVRSASTTRASNRAKISARRPRPAKKVGEARRWFGLAPKPARDPLTLTIVFRGGAECWYEVHARGEVGRFPGYVALHDAMHEIYGHPR